MNRKTPTPISSPEGRGRNVAHDELGPLGDGGGAGEVSVASATIRPLPPATITVAGRLGSGGRHEGRVEVALADVVRRLGDRRHLADVEGRAAPLLEAGPQRRRLGRRPDDAELDPIRLRLVVDADDAEREPDHEEDGHDQGAQREPRLLALLLLLGCWLGHRPLPVVSWSSAVPREHVLLGDGARVSADCVGRGCDSHQGDPSRSTNRAPGTPGIDEAN